MSLPRTYVSFSSSDITSYRMMLAWKAHEHIDFDFIDYQLAEAIDSTRERYIKDKLRPRISRASRFILLIGADTRLKTLFVKWEVEVAIEEKCILIGANLNHHWQPDLLRTPSWFSNVGIVFVPFSSRIIRHAIEDSTQPLTGNLAYPANLYTQLGYVIAGKEARIPPKPNPFAAPKPYNPFDRL